MSDAIHAPFWLKDTFAPTPDEVSTSSLEVLGTIPTDLKVRYLRTGLNPISGPSEHGFLGDGMIHGMELADGEANSFKSKLIQTPMLGRPEEENDFARENTSDFVVLDALEPERGPIARVKLGVRVPFGFHGSWIADER